MKPIPLDPSTVRPAIELPPICIQEPSPQDHPQSLGHRVFEALQNVVKTVSHAFHGHQIKETTIKDLPSAAMSEIFSNLTSGAYERTCKAFAAHTRELRIKQAEALYQMNKRTRLLEIFGVPCNEPSPTYEQARALLAETKRMVNRLNKSLPEALKFTGPSLDVVLNCSTLEAFLKQKYNLDLLWILGPFANVPEDMPLEESVETIQNWVKSEEAQRLPDLAEYRHRRFGHSLFDVPFEWYIPHCLPLEICELKGLNLLDLKSTLIHFLPPELGKLPVLEYVWLPHFSQLSTEYKPDLSSIPKGWKLEPDPETFFGKIPSEFDLRREENGEYHLYKKIYPINQLTPTPPQTSRQTTASRIARAENKHTQ